MRSFLLLVTIIFLFPLSLFGDVDTFEGQTATDTWEGFSTVDTREGFTIASGGGEPTYSSDQCTGGTVTAYAYFSASYIPAYAFDDNTTTVWFSGYGATTWIQYDFGSGVAHPISRVKVYPYVDGSISYCLNFRILGSNDGNSWDVLLTDTDTLIDGWNTVDFTNTTSYRYIRFDQFTYNAGASNYVAIKEVEMMYEE